MFVCLSVFKYNKEQKKSNIGHGIFKQCNIGETYYTILDTSDGCIDLLSTKELEICHDKRIPIKGLDWYKRGKNFIVRPVIIPKIYDWSEIRKICGYDVHDFHIWYATDRYEKLTIPKVGKYFGLYVWNDNNGAQKYVVECKRLESDASDILIKILTLDITVKISVDDVQKMIS